MTELLEDREEERFILDYIFFHFIVVHPNVTRISLALLSFCYIMDIERLFK